MSPMVCRTCGSVLVSWEDYTCHKCHKRDAVYRPSKKEEEVEEELEVEEEEVVPDPATPIPRRSFPRDDAHACQAARACKTNGGKGGGLVPKTHRDGNVAVPDKWAGRTCPHCGRVFRKVMSFAAHVRRCNVANAASAPVDPEPAPAPVDPEPAPVPAPDPAPVPVVIPPAPVRTKPVHVPATGKMQIVTINIPDVFLYACEVLVQQGLYPSRSEAVRDALRRFLTHELEVMTALLALGKGVEAVQHQNQNQVATSTSNVIDMRRVRVGWNKQ